jgi:membrane peptidoglycan carboxypeptidase
LQDITKAKSAASQVMDPRIAFMVTDILRDNNARSEEFGTNSALKLSRPSAAKTGTTNDFRDNWTIGYTPQIVTAVWVGNNDHTPMINVDGITGAGPIWHDYMEYALKSLPVKDFVQPPGLARSVVCQVVPATPDPLTVDPNADPNQPVPTPAPTIVTSSGELDLVERVKTTTCPTLPQTPDSFGRQGRDRSGNDPNNPNNQQTIDPNDTSKPGKSPRKPFAPIDTAQ